MLFFFMKMYTALIKTSLKILSTVRCCMTCQVPNSSHVSVSEIFQKPWNRTAFTIIPYLIYFQRLQLFGQSLWLNLNFVIVLEQVRHNTCCTHVKEVEHVKLLNCIWKPRARGFWQEGEEMSSCSSSSRLLDLRVKHSEKLAFESFSFVPTHTASVCSHFLSVLCWTWYIDSLTLSDLLVAVDN